MAVLALPSTTSYKAEYWAKDVIIQENLFISSLTRNIPSHVTHQTLLSLYEAKQWDENVAYAVMMAESGGNPNAINPTDNHGSCFGSYSLYQVGCFWYVKYGIPKEEWLNADINESIAYKIWENHGWGEWSTYNNGEYLKYLQ